MQEKFIFVEQTSGKPLIAVVESRPVCADCPGAIPQTGPGPSGYKRRLDRGTMRLQISCGGCGKPLAEYPVTEGVE